MIIDRKGMQKIESLSGFSSLEIMETVSRLIADKIMHAFSRQDSIVVLAGKGNNGGDGVAIARILHQHGYQSAIYLAGNPDHRTEEMQRQC